MDDVSEKSMTGSLAATGYRDGTRGRSRLHLRRKICTYTRTPRHSWEGSEPDGFRRFTENWGTRSLCGTVIRAGDFVVYSFVHQTIDDDGDMRKLMMTVIIMMIMIIIIMRRKMIMMTIMSIYGY